MSLDDCSEFHHAIMKEIENLVPYLEISSRTRPSSDREMLKKRGWWKFISTARRTDRKLRKLVGLINSDHNRERRGKSAALCWSRKDCALVIPVIKYEDIEEDKGMNVEFS